MIPESFCLLCVSEALGAVSPIRLPRKQTCKVMDSKWLVDEVIYTLSDAFKALQAVVADLQPAASGPMIAEKQPTLKDDC